jgi:hypothetical protein
MDGWVSSSTSDRLGIRCQIQRVPDRLAWFSPELGPIKRQRLRINLLQRELGQSNIVGAWRWRLDTHCHKHRTTC